MPAFRAALVTTNPSGSVGRSRVETGCRLSRTTVAESFRQQHSPSVPSSNCTVFQPKQMLAAGRGGYSVPKGALRDLPATGTLRLNRRTLNRAIRAEHAAIARSRPQQLLATGALVKELAGIHGHGLFF